MAKKKNRPTKSQRREIRRQRAREWVAAYAGDDMVNDYIRHLNVSLDCAVRDLTAIGALSAAQANEILPAEQTRHEDMEHRAETVAKQVLGGGDAPSIPPAKKQSKSNNKKSMSKAQRRRQRLQTAREWFKTYKGDNILQDYCNRFQMDGIHALLDLRELNLLSDEKLDELQQIVNQQQRNKAKRLRSDAMQTFPYSDDRFLYIAGYTSGGAPYGVTWEEAGLEPYQLLE